MLFLLSASSISIPLAAPAMTSPVDISLHDDDELRKNPTGLCLPNDSSIENWGSDDEEAGKPAARTAKSHGEQYINNTQEQCASVHESLPTDETSLSPKYSKLPALSSRKRKSMNDDDIDFLPNAPNMAFVPAVAPPNPDDEAALVPNCMADLPHTRENCVTFPFASSNHRQHCKHCICYVCDQEAAQCTQWQLHCVATHSDARWRREREQVKQQHLKSKTASDPPKVLQPATDRAATAFGTHQKPAVQDLLSAVTRIYPRETNPPPPFRTHLCHYQKQSLAFMQDVEESGDPIQACTSREGLPVRGGWLCQEVGMGKSAIVIALVASDKQDTTTQMYRTKGGALLTPVKTTVILTPVSLMGQWEDECRKHAPHLKVTRYHRSVRKVPTNHDIEGADIIFSTATFSWDKSIVDSFLFRRVVMDESHLFFTAPSSANIRYAQKIRSTRRWCVTATPMTTFHEELVGQAEFLRMSLADARKLVLDAELLKPRMIRHVKTQSIHGSAALTLPESTTNIVKVAMLSDEQRLYHATIQRFQFQLSCLKNSDKAKAFYIQRSVLYPLSAPFMHAYSSKVAALHTALVHLLRRDAHMRAVVFTQYRPMQHLVQEMVCTRLGIAVSSFDGSTISKKRDQAIREFQSVQVPGAAVFVVTLRTGSVGITLTAASHVFLMEPCVNPTDEIQAAGRIHRLGQTRPVQVTKLVYENNVETNILLLHKEIEQGRLQFSNDGGLTRVGLQILLRGVV